MIPWQKNKGASDLAATSSSKPALREVSVSWLLAPALILWLATTWTPFDIALTLLAAIPALWVWWSKRGGAVAVNEGSATVILIAGLGAIAFDLLVPRLAAVDPGTAHMVHVGGCLVLIAVWLSIHFGAYRAGLVAVLVFSIIVGSWSVVRVEEPGIDVWRLHKGAASLLSSGGNPYSDLDLPKEANSVSGPFQQYGYPPVTLGWYAGWTMLVGDPRWASLIAWLIMLALSWVVIARMSNPSLGLAIMTYTAIQPGWFLLLTGSFTEPLIAMLVMLFLAARFRHPVLGAVILGLAVSSKQHLLLTLPAIVLGWTWVDRQKAIVTTGTAIGAFSVGLIFGPTNYLGATVFGPAQIGANPDSVTLYGLAAKVGLEWTTPAILAIVVASVTAVCLSGPPRTPGWPVRKMGMIIAVYLSLTQAALWSHWVLVALLITIAVMGDDANIDEVVVSRASPKALTEPTP